MARASQQRFDGEMFRAAVAYYGLPTNYRRFFTPGAFLRRHEVRRGGLTAKVMWTPILAPSHPERDSQDGRIVWAQINMPAPGFPLRLARVDDIDVYQNLSLDFEFPPDPSVALDIGVDLAKHLLDLGFAKPHDDWLIDGKPGMPIEWSGAGVHIGLPLPALRTAALGGPDIIDDAVHNLVQRYVQPRYDQLLAQRGLAGMFPLEGYDVSILLSLPGTWRPPLSKKDDCEALRAGFLRRWYVAGRVESRRMYPSRRESGILADLIVEECASLGEIIA
jgi:hypothetical protein